jgi:hypothetical protein
MRLYYENNKKYPNFNYLWAHDYDWFECYEIEMLVFYQLMLLKRKFIWVFCFGSRINDSKKIICHIFVSDFVLYMNSFFHFIFDWILFNYLSLFST